MAYRDFPIEQARQLFDEIKGEPVRQRIDPVVKVRRKLRIPAKDSK